MPQHPGLRLLHGLGVELVYMHYTRENGTFQYQMLECRPQVAAVS